LPLNIRAALLDFDNTLFYSFESYYVALNEALKQLELPELSREEFIKLYRLSELNVPLNESLPSLLRSRGVYVSSDLSMEILSLYKAIFAEVDLNLTFTPAANIDALSTLASYLKVAVVSARLSKKGILSLLDKYKVSKYIDYVVTARDAESIKPSEKPLVLAALKLGVEPEACVMIGDSPRDMQAGKRARMKTIGVASGVWSADDLLRSGADEVVGLFPESVDVVMKWLKAGSTK